MISDEDTLDSQSLIYQAQNHTLPALQYMDDATQKWIAKNEPRYDVVSRLNFDLQSYTDWTSHFPLRRDWFPEPRLADTVHGLRHLLRTAYFACCLAKEKELGRTQTIFVFMAAQLHDIRRQDDRGDPGHAQRSADWFIANAPTVAKQWRLKLTDEYCMAIAAVISLHETPYGDFGREQRVLYERHQVAVDILKTADALDRYRLPKLKWWINDEYLNLVPSSAMKQLAFNLVVRSERYFLEGVGNERSVNRAIHNVVGLRKERANLWREVHTR